LCLGLLSLADHRANRPASRISVNGKQRIAFTQKDGSPQFSGVVFNQSYRGSQNLVVG
jgi:hypothetical protein